jgi:hypothetical protein
MGAFVDSFGHRSKGHYRSWIIPTQVLTIAILSYFIFFTDSIPE